LIAHISSKGRGGWRRACTKEGVENREKQRKSEREGPIRPSLFLSPSFLLSLAKSLSIRMSQTDERKKERE